MGDHDGGHQHGHEDEGTHDAVTGQTTEEDQCESERKDELQRNREFDEHQGHPDRVPERAVGEEVLVVVGLGQQQAVDDVMTFIPEGAIPKPHQQGAIKSVLPIVGSGAGDMTLLKVTPEKYENTINQLKKLGFLTKDVDVASTYDRTFYDTMGPVPAP